MRMYVLLSYEIIIPACAEVKRFVSDLIQRAVRPKCVWSRYSCIILKYFFGD